MGSTCAFCRPRSRTSSFEFQDVHKFERNPMIYAHCADVNIYIKRNFAPLEDRVRSIIAIEVADPEHSDRRQNESGGGFAEAIRRTRDPNRSRFRRFSAQGHGDSGRGRERRGGCAPISWMPNRKAATALSDFATWLEKEKLPKATSTFAWAKRSYQRWLTETELVDLAAATRFSRSDWRN